MTLDVEYARSWFPALDTGWALMDNAGGSVAPRPVIERVTEYLSRYQVQLGASYPLSQQAMALVRAGEATAAALLGASMPETIVGPSTTVNLKTLARALAPTFAPGDEIVVTDLDHESNIGCWRDTARQGMVVREWKLRPQTARLELEDLASLLGPRTKIVCFTHCANVVGEIVDVPAVVSLIRDRSDAMVCVDGVAFAPHRRVDVEALGVDFYAMSLYKVYGPHLGALYGRREHLLRAQSQNHDFVPDDQLPYKFQPGNVTHELAAGITGIGDYLDALARHQGIEAPEREARWAGVFDRIAAHEEALSERLLGFLRDHPRVRVLGPSASDSTRRVPTVAFTVDGRHAQEVPPLLEEAEVAVRWGHFYAKRAIDALGLAEAGGVVRVSMVHYNTLAEVDRLVARLDAVL